jgi:hypothetical protein
VIAPEVERPEFTIVSVSLYPLMPGSKPQFREGERVYPWRTEFPARWSWCDGLVQGVAGQRLGCCRTRFASVQRIHVRGGSVQRRPDLSQSGPMVVTPEASESLRLYLLSSARRKGRVHVG